MDMALDTQLSEMAMPEDCSDDTGLNKLIAYKLNWLTQAHDQRICEKIVEVTQTLGKRAVVHYDTSGQAYVFEKDGLTLHSFIRLGAHIPGAYNRYRKHIAVWGFVEGVKDRIVYLKYTDGRPEFPKRGCLFAPNVEETNYIFIPGRWVETLEECYSQAQGVTGVKVIHNRETRANRLAAQLLIKPRVEV
ncbi:MAG: hypothetical protein JW908_00705 [Anaerolineales bacterium]|nr:hypothetical protein [Anaerolineales bacterium]